MDFAPFRNDCSRPMFLLISSFFLCFILISGLPSSSALTQSHKVSTHKDAQQLSQKLAETQVDFSEVDGETGSTSNSNPLSSSSSSSLSPGTNKINEITEVENPTTPMVTQPPEKEAVEIVVTSGESKLSSSSSPAPETASKEGESGTSIKSSDKYVVESTTTPPNSAVVTEHPILMPSPEPLHRNHTGNIPLRGKCNNTEQCKGEHTECRTGMCKCELGYLPRIDDGDRCGEAQAHYVEPPTTDPTMIGVVIGLALMSVTLCVVMRLFAKARFRENRTIFNTPNPRLMNVSLLQSKGGNKNLIRGNSAGQRSRRGSQQSVNSGGDIEAPAAAAGPPSRARPSRQLSTDEPSHPPSRPISATNKAKFRQDSVASNAANP